MISERAIPARPRAAARRQSRTWQIPRLSSAPARAGRERLAEALGKSVLVQLMLAMTFIALAALLYMAQESQISVQQINIAGLRAQHMQLAADNVSLRSSATSLQETPRIDTIATTTLGMSIPDASSRMWLTVSVPALQPQQPIDADTIAAERNSQPLAWMSRALHELQDSL